MHESILPRGEQEKGVFFFVMVSSRIETAGAAARAALPATR